MVNLNIKLPDEFLNEEVRCGYTISHKMKEVWAVELDLLNELLRVCKKYDIKIFANGGTMLGAARHHGFIPWDDDIDTMLTRDEYNRLCDVANKEFQYPYFFQTESTDPGSLRGHAQLRRSDTTGALISEKNRKDINQGIFIDVFPMDVLPKEDVFNKWRNNLRYCLTNAQVLYKPYGLAPSWKFLLRRNLKLPFIYSKPTKYWYDKYERECCIYNNTNGHFYGIMKFLLNSPYDMKKPINLYQSSVMYLPFEMLQIPVPKRYDEALTAQFGNWHEFVRGGEIHGDILFDTCRSYKEVLNYPET